MKKRTKKKRTKDHARLASTGRPQVSRPASKAAGGLKQRVETLTHEVRALKGALKVSDLNYCWLADLVMDAQDSLNAGEPIDEAVLAEFKRYTWKTNGDQLGLADVHKVTGFSRQWRDAPDPRPARRSA
jgi:hypothetical protein